MTESNSSLRSMPDYTLRVPFQLAPGRELKDLGEPWEEQVDALRFRLSRDGGQYVIWISGFGSEAQAGAYLPNVWAGLTTALVERDMAFTASWELDEVVMAADPEAAARNLHSKTPVDAISDGRRPSVFESHLGVKFVTAGSVGVLRSSSRDQFLPHLIKGAEASSPGEAFNDDRLRTALDLYSAATYERSKRGQILTFVMALEALAKGVEKRPFVQSLMDRWQEQLSAAKSQAKGLDLEDLHALERELLFRRESSLRTNIARLVTGAVRLVDPVQAEAWGSRAKALYDLRSTLVHEGSLSRENLTKAAHESRVISTAVLRIRHAAACGLNPQDVVLPHQE